MTWPFPLNPRYAKNVIRNADWEAIYQFLPHIGRSKIYSFPLQPRNLFLKRNFKIYDLLVFFVSRGLDLRRTKDSPESRNLRCLFAKSFWNMHTRTVLRVLLSFLCVRYNFFWCYRNFWFEGNNKYAEKVLRQPWSALPLQFHFGYVTDKIFFTLQVYFTRSVSLKFSECFSQF